MLKNFTPRLYQETILQTCLNSNSLVVLPTGLGKTGIALLLTIQRLTQYPESKVLILAPTKPLVEQHLDSFKKLTDITKMVVFTGLIKPEKRAELWKEAKIIFSTPQGFENDIMSRKIDIKDVSLIVFDEAHRAVKEYAYVWLAKQYNNLAKYPKILGLTASPGNDLETIKEVCDNLFIDDIEVREESDPDVKEYVQELKQTWVMVPFPEEFGFIKNVLETCINNKFAEIKNLGLGSPSDMSRRSVLGFQSGLSHEIAQGNRDMNVLKSISLVAEAMKAMHALELLETQGISPLHAYMDGLILDSQKTNVKATKNLVADINFRTAFSRCKLLLSSGIEHPKLLKLVDTVKKEMETKKDFKIIVFSQYRDTINKIVKELNTIVNVDARVFVGQAKKKSSGMSQKQQVALLNDFREGFFNILVSSSVGEEGLDIPAVDAVIFYEPIPSAIRTVQRRGRTGRLQKGHSIVLVTQGTRDESYRWSSFHKEKRMYRTLKTIKNNLGLRKEKQSKITIDDEFNVRADFREKGSAVMKLLIEQGAKLTIEKIDVGDYVLSQRVCVEFKTVYDFVDSIIDGRLFSQVKELKSWYERPLIIIEGTQDLYTVRNIHPNAIRGALAMLTVNYGIPLLRTSNPKETALMLAIIAKREQTETTKEFNLHGGKKPLPISDLQEYIISAFPGVGPSMAKPLLSHFKSIKSIINANEHELIKVEKVGTETARKIADVVNIQYKKEE